MGQTNLNIGTIGQKLEAARNEKGISVTEAGHATKILSKFIEAMENDDFGALSAPVYAKSFIKMYARYLGLDANPLVEEYLAQHAPKTKPQLSDEVRQNIAVDQVDAADMTVPKKEGSSIFGNVDKVIPGLAGTKLPPMKYILAGVGALMLILILISAKQCADDQDEAPAAAGGAASVPRQELVEGTPDLYLVKPGVVEMGK